MSEEEQSKGFKVRDRRRVAEDGELRQDADAQTATPPRAEPSAPRSGPARSAAPRSVDFSAVVLSIATNAAMCLSGDSGDDRIAGQVDLQGAAQHIDVLALLEEKTRGNLTPDEATLLTDVLRDLRMGYVQVAQAAPNATKPRA
jgi:hypothetical protein